MLEALVADRANQPKSLQVALRSLRAVAFDLDGVLVDTERLHFIAHQQALQAAGISIDEAYYARCGVSTDPFEFYAAAGGSTQLSSEQLRQIHCEKQAIYRALAMKWGITPITPAVSAVRRLADRGMPLALVTAVSRLEAEYILNDIAIGGCFRVVISGSDTNVRNKPFPDMYLRAATLLGFRASDCLAVEDSQNGVKAALAAGFECVVVPSRFTADQNWHAAHVLTSCQELLDAFEEGSVP